MIEMQEQDCISIPLVSVVLCTYNDEKYIRETIESVLAQTYTDFEFIIWDDGSTDNTACVVQSYKDRRIRYFYHDNTGLGQALFLACKEAKGKYIARIDGDDVCTTNRLECQVNFLETNPEVVLVASSVIYIDGKSNVIGRSFPWTWRINIKKRINIFHPSVMFRRDIYNKTCGYLNLLSSQDRILWSKMIRFGDFATIKEPLVMYRWIDTSISHVIDNSNSYTILLEQIRRKMCTDNVVSNEDINLHNEIYRLAKNKSLENNCGYKQSFEEKLAIVLSKFVGKSLSFNIVFFTKNLYAFFRYLN